MPHALNKSRASRPHCHNRRSGFTLIELSIVLVIIGLIVGGVLVGQDLISAAATRATLAQIEKYNSAVNTFRSKYNALPGDIPATQAAQCGFVARSGIQGRGDGNGLIEGYYYQGASMIAWDAYGETAFFWEDLSNANFIDGSFTTATDAPPGATVTNPGFYFPAAKIGSGNYINVYSMNGVNYFNLVNVGTINVNDNMLTSSGVSPVSTTLTVAQAYMMDKKADDGLPQSGRVQAFYNDGWGGGTGANNYVRWSGGAAALNGAGYTTATPGSASTCFDNGSGSGPQQYSTEQNNGSGPNCGLSFVMQGAAR